MDLKELAKNQESLTKEIKKIGLHFKFKTYFLICIRKEDIFESVIREITGHTTRKIFYYFNKLDEDVTRKAIERVEVFFVTVYQNVDQTKK